MAFRNAYKDQVALLIRTLPHVADESCFALKGGTAINLFIRNMPRLSVDIDLTYLPMRDRKEALADIDGALRRIAGRLRQGERGIQITESGPDTQTTTSKLIVRAQDRVQIKIEVTPVLRGAVYGTTVARITETAEELFGFAEIKILSFADIYAGKVMAALDRQHPRDLFDVHLLLENDGVSDDLRAAIIVYLVSHDHSPHTLLNPVRRDIEQDFEQNFAGMTEEPVSLEILLLARENLIRDVTGNMPDKHKEFLRSFYNRTPDWQLLGVEGVANLPAVRWREFNLDKAGKGTREELLRKLAEVLSA